MVAFSFSVINRHIRRLCHKMFRKYKNLNKKHCRVICNACNLETTLKLEHYEVVCDEDNCDELRCDRITWMCSICEDSEASYTPFTVEEFNLITDNSFQLRSRMIPKIPLSTLFPDGLVFRQNEPFHTL